MKGKAQRALMLLSHQKLRQGRRGHYIQLVELAEEANSKV
jgi:hypothetical protein